MPGLGSSVARTVAAKATPDMPPGVSLNSASNANTTTATTANGRTTSTTTMANGKPKLDPSDPRVRKLVYSMYRNMLTTCNDEANDIISKKDPTKVTQDLGVGPILESIIIRQRGSQEGGVDVTGPTSTASEGQTDGGTSNGTSTMAPPPPPPPMMPGSLPTTRLSSEIGPRDKGPPAALAGAMMKDKKPFTYTPGGIDLSEIRSPRMAKRIQMNAAAEGVTNTPKPASSSDQERTHCNLPPAAFAAMQPQMAIPVFPQGNINAVQLNKMHKPIDYAGPPPPPPPPTMSAPVMRPQMPPAPPLPQQTLYPTRQGSPPHPKSPPPPPARTPPPPIERAATPKSPVPFSDSHLGPSRPTSSQSTLQDSERPERRSPIGVKLPISIETGAGVGTGSLFIPPIQSSVPQGPPPPPPPFQTMSPVSNYVPGSRSPGQTKAQAVSQNIGSLYIPPIGAQQADDNQPSSGSGGSTTNGNNPRTPPSAQVIPNTPQTASSVPPTAQLNKAPTPWMNSYNRMQNNQIESPPYVHPGFFMPPWSGPPGPPGTRTIPIMMATDQMDGAGSPFQGMTDSRRSSSASGGSNASGSRTPSQAAIHLGRVIPIQIEREEAGRAKGSKIIPIQIEGRPPRAMTPSTPTTPFMNPMKRPAGPPPCYNTPIGLYSNQNAMDAYQRQAAEAAAGVDRMNIRCESPRTDPMQSKSLRVIQQASENELKRIEQEQEQSWDMSEDDRHLMGMSQVDEGSSLHQTAEPRFMGGHIPSKAFRALQTALPSSSPSGAPDQPPSSFPASQPSGGGPITHHIPIRQVAQSPTPQSQASEIQLSSQHNLPPSEQKVQEPKKYMGSNIPSRSFKILQAMTAEDGQPEVEGSDETCTTEQTITDSYNDDTLSPFISVDPNNPPLSPSYSSSSYPLSLSCSSEGGGSATFEPYNNGGNNNNSTNGNDGNPNSENPWSDVMDQGWDPYTYMWYYWWYYTSCYWAGYDMTGYEYPPGWDPNYPFCPPELFSDYSALSEYQTGTEDSNASSAETMARGEYGQEYNLERESSSSPDLHKSLRSAENGVGEERYYGYDNNNDDNSSSRRRKMMPFIENNSRVAESLLSSTVPEIVIEDGDNVVCAGEGKLGSKDRDSIKKNNSCSVDSIKDSNKSLCNNNNNNNNNKSTNHNGNTAAKAPYTNPLTECNQKPGNPTSLSCKKNDCDSVVYAGERWKIEQKDKFAECKQQHQLNGKSGSDNDVDEKRVQKEKGAYNNEEVSSPSSSDDEYESCCEDTEQKVIERETGPCNSKPFVTSTSSTSQNFPIQFSENDEQHQQWESRQRKFVELHGNYNSELNEKDDDDGHGRGIGDDKEKVNDDDDDENEDDKTDPGTDEDNDDDYGGRGALIEEPETPSSADDSDVTSLVSEHDQQRAGKSSFYCNGNLTIEEYHSENSSSESTLLDYGLKKNRLSTIDEITESRASSSMFSNRTSAAATPTAALLTTGKNLSAEFEYCANKNSSSCYTGSGGNLIRDDYSTRNRNDVDATAITNIESDESEDSSDELSSVSVIENKSDATRGTIDSKREDETTSTSEEDSSSDDDDNNIEEEEDDDDEDEAEGIDTAVTVRLPLKLCFTKTKSYKDITTVMVGDSEIEEVSQASSNEINEPKSHSSTTTTTTATTCNANDDHVSESNDFPVEETDDEPVVSFTLSLSRQTSREDETKVRTGKINEGCNEKVGKDTKGNGEAPDIDFWAEITKGEEKEEEYTRATTTITTTSTITTANTDKVKSNQEYREDYDEKETNNSEGSDMGFWGIICRDRSVSDFPRRNRKQNERADEPYNGLSQTEHAEMSTLSEDKQEWDPSESIDYKWEKDFNFWEKSSRTIEPRRFSGKFEITEDYESDSGIKPSVEKKERVKRYTHKRHSIPGPSWDRSSLPPRPTQKQSTSNISTKHSPSNCNEEEIKTEERKSCGNENNRSMEQVERRTRENNESFSLRRKVESYHEDSEETSSWWSYWDEVTKESGENEKFENNEDETRCGGGRNETQVEPGVSSSKLENNGEIVGTAGSQEKEESVDVSVEIKLSGGRHKRSSSSISNSSSKKENNGCSGEDDYQSFACMQASRMEARGSGGISSPERKEDEVKDRKSLNHSCQSDATTVTTDNEDYSSSPEIKFSLLFSTAANQEAEKLIQQGSAYVSVSDENSDESSSRSSGTTIGRHDKTEIKKQIISSTLPSVQTASPEAASASSDVCTAVDESLLLKSSPVEKEQGESNLNNTAAPVDTFIQIPVSIEKCVESQQPETVSEMIPVNGREQQQQHDHQEEHYHHGCTSSSTTAVINTTSSSATSTTTTTCTCLMNDRIARAENLLWRIERFLHESLSLGSDSGVMTDLSRQISDVDTDVDNDLNETEFLLTAAAAAKDRRGMASALANSNNNKEAQHIESCNFGETISSTDASMHHHTQQQTPASNNNLQKGTTNSSPSPASTQVKKPRPKSDIFAESSLLAMVETEEAASTAATIVEENNGVKMRSASERRSLRYQRAKTHSRLFQLLQDECGRDDELDEFDYDSDVAVPSTYMTSNNQMAVAVDCQINVDAGSADIHHHHHHSHSPTCNVMNDDDCNNSANASSPTKMNDTQARRSRLLPLPIKNLLASSLSLDSNSSPSGSSGVLSPTSPINRDQLLADIINEFHLRNQASTVRAQNQRRISTSFPSKIFKLLQHEFGEEFYQTFDCCGGIAEGEDSLISPSMSTNLCVNDSTSSSDGAPFVHECTIHKSESMKEFEEATNKILTNFMLRNTTTTTSTTSKQNKVVAFSESPTANLSSHSLQDDSKNCSNVEFLEVPLRKKKGNLSRDPRSSSKSTKKF